MAGGTDFNDLHVMFGIDEVRRQLDAALVDPWPVAASDSTVDCLPKKESAANSETTKGKRAMKKNKDVENGGAAAESLKMFISDSKGIYWYNRDKRQYDQISDWLEVVAHTRSKIVNRESRSWGRLVRFRDRDNELKQWNIPESMFSGEGIEVIKGLCDRGLKIHHTTYQADRKLREYLRGVEVPSRVVLVDKMGWHGNAFMLPDRVIGAPPEPLHYHAEAASVCKMARAGTLDGWRDNVAAFAVGNDLVGFVISAAFAAPLLGLLSRPTVGFHFFGDSSWGKSTLLNIAASVCGAPGQQGYGHTWRGTDNAIEYMAAAHSDCLFVLDELKQCEARVVEQTVYMLGNGEGKARAAENGGAGRARHNWRLVVLSNGEVTLSQHLAEIKKKPYAGQEMRLLHVEANFNQTSALRSARGIYQDVRDYAGGMALSGHILTQAGHHHGTAFPAFLEKLLDPAFDENKRLRWINDKIADFRQEALSGAGGQAARAADAFGVVAAAGEMATMFGVTGWPKGTATKAALACFRAWLVYYGGAGSKENRDMLLAVRSHFSTCGEFNYSRMNENDPIEDEHAARTAVKYGWRKTKTEGDSMTGKTSKTVFYVYVDAFRNEICKGYSWKRVAELLVDAGALITSGETDRKTQKKTLPGMGDKRVSCYVIDPSALYDDGEDDDSEIDEKAIAA